MYLPYSHASKSVKLFFKNMGIARKRSKSKFTSMYAAVIIMIISYTHAFNTMHYLSKGKVLSKSSYVLNKHELDSAFKFVKHISQPGYALYCSMIMAITHESNQISSETNAKN